MHISNRSFLGAGRATIAAIGLILSLSSCQKADKWQLVDMANAYPPLDFTMTRVNDGAQVSGKDFRGKIVILEFGFTFCPDVCPLTLSNLSTVLRKLPSQGKDVTILFATVDPNRDLPADLKRYVENFGPQAVGLRGTPDHLAALARRYRVAYSVKPAAKPDDYEVMHTATIFFFDRTGKLRLLSPDAKNVDAIAHDLRRLIDEPAA